MARFCTECGATLADDKKFCTKCGTPVGAAAGEAGKVQVENAAEQSAEVSQPVQSAHQQQTPPPVQPAYRQTMQAPPPVMSVQQVPPVYGADIAPAKGSKYDPITTWGYIGIMLLMCIPVVGLILMLVWAFGGCKKVNKRNLARASLIMAAIGLIFSLVIGLLFKSLVGTVVGKVEEETGLSGLTGLMTGEESEEIPEESSDSELSALMGLLGGAAVLESADGSGSNSNITNQDIQELEALSDMLDALEGINGEGSTDGLSEFAEKAADINREAEAKGTGWPKELRPYPSGTQTATASYRTEITGTTYEEMWAYIDELKSDGYEFQDFYDMGMSEEDMADYGWWGTDGTVYVSISYSDGAVIIDHMYELPDMSSLLGG